MNQDYFSQNENEFIETINSASKENNNLILNVKSNQNENYSQLFQTDELGIITSKILKNSQMPAENIISTVSEEANQTSLVSDFSDNPEPEPSASQNAKMSESNESKPEAEGDQTIHQIGKLKRENLWLKNEINHKDIMIRELTKDKEQGEVLLSIVKRFILYKQEVKKDFQEAIKLFEYVIGFCKSYDFFYVHSDSGGKSQRQNPETVVQKMNLLFNRLNEGFLSLNKINNHISSAVLEKKCRISENDSTNHMSLNSLYKLRDYENKLNYKKRANISYENDAKKMEASMTRSPRLLLKSENVLNSKEQKIQDLLSLSNLKDDDNFKVLGVEDVLQKESLASGRTGDSRKQRTSCEIIPGYLIELGAKFLNLEIESKNTYVYSKRPRFSFGGFLDIFGKKRSTLMNIKGYIENGSESCEFEDSKAQNSKERNYIDQNVILNNFSFHRNKSSKKASQKSIFSQKEPKTIENDKKKIATQNIFQKKMSETQENICDIINRDLSEFEHDFRTLQTLNQSSKDSTEKMEIESNYIECFNLKGARRGQRQAALLSNRNLSQNRQKAKQISSTPKQNYSLEKSQKKADLSIDKVKTIWFKGKSSRGSNKSKRKLRRNFSNFNKKFKKQKMLYTNAHTGKSKENHVAANKKKFFKSYLVPRREAEMWRNINVRRNRANRSRRAKKIMNNYSKGFIGDMIENAISKDKKRRQCNKENVVNNYSINLNIQNQISKVKQQKQRHAKYPFIVSKNVVVNFGNEI